MPVSDTRVFLLQQHTLLQQVTDEDESQSTRCSKTVDRLDAASRWTVLGARVTLSAAGDVYCCKTVESLVCVVRSRSQLRHTDRRGDFRFETSNFGLVNLRSALGIPKSLATGS